MPPAETHTAAPDLSVVIPAYNEQNNLAPLSAELTRVLSGLGLTWEIIFVDDGSRDGSWRTLQHLHCVDPRVGGLRLARNFGHQHALLAGLFACRGKAAISMDADFQHPPEVIRELVARWREGHRVVKTQRQELDELPWLKRAASRAYYRIFSYLSGVELQPGLSDFRLLDRQVLDELLRLGESDVFLRGLVEWMGYPSAVVPFQCGRRLNGTSKYSLRKMLRLAWHGISAFSLVPLRVATLVGFIASGLAFIGVVYAIVSKLLSGATVPGWTSSVAILSFLFGVLFAFLAVLAEYLGRVLVEVRARPRFLLAEQLTPEATPIALTPAPWEMDVAANQ